jgi:K+-sensing histidine kinase KdpD
MMRGMSDQGPQGSLGKPVRHVAGPSFAVPIRLAQSWVGPIAMSLALVGVTTYVLWYAEVNLDLDPLVFIYFVPTTYIALRYGSIAAMIAAVMSCAAAAYYLYPPNFSFAVGGVLDVMQLVFFMLLAILASQVVSGFVKDKSVERRRPRSRLLNLGEMRLRLSAFFAGRRAQN